MLANKVIEDLNFRSSGLSKICSIDRPSTCSTEAFKNAVPVESTIYVTPTLGGPLTRISEGGYWDDKPRWSPDGRVIYFVSGRNGVFNVWGVHFDAVEGKPVGAPFRVTSFESPGLVVGDNISGVEFSLVQDKFILTMEDHSGSIWVLDNVDR